MSNKKSLKEKSPEAATMWHPKKNGMLTPDLVPWDSREEVWWIYEYDDEFTGKHFVFEWMAKVYNMAKYPSCPYLTNKKVWPGFNDLRTKYPDIAAQWHPTKNGDWTPDTVVAGSRAYAWWFLPYDDPDTGKHFEFEWEAKIFARTVKHTGCPYLTGKAVWPGYNDLQTKYPEIAAQWHPTKNGDLTPDKVIAGSEKRAWWLLPYDDPETGKHFDFEWETDICSRTSNNLGCPYLSNSALWTGYNDLQTKYPEIAAQWHPTKNGDLTPDKVLAGSNKHAWWFLPYDDPETGRHFDFEWESAINVRTGLNAGCPYLSGNALWPGYNDLKTKYPEIAAQWHPTKNGDLTPDKVLAGSNKHAWWFLPYDDPETGRHFDFEWETDICSRTRNNLGCPYLSNNALWPGYNDLQTKYPEIAAQWHPTKNGDLTPDKVLAGSHKHVWWFLPYDDPETGRHFDFEWKAGISTRITKSQGCPFLLGKAVWPGFNDLQTKYPKIAAQWHPTKNGDLTPDRITVGCNKRVWWMLPYDDPETGKHFDFEWEAVVNTRICLNEGCPYLSNSALWPGYNDLQTKYPEIAAQWHPTKNGGLTPDKVLAGSIKHAWWFLPYDDPETGRHFDFEWETAINVRTSMNADCPYLSNSALWTGYNDLQTKFPEIAAQWHPTKNGDLTPDKVLAGSHEHAWWFLPYDDPETGRHFDFEWETSINARTSLNTGCPYLSNSALWPGYNDLQTKYPEIAAQWHPTKNGALTPDKVIAGSQQWATWLMPYDDPATGKHFDFEWDSRIIDRIKGPTCPYLLNFRVWPGYNDLKSCYPEIAKEWNESRNRTSPDKVLKTSTHRVWWICPYGHEWRTSVAARTRRGSGCPKCSKLRRRYGDWTT